MEAVIWAYIDGTCNAAERAHAEAQMGRDAGWRAKYQELLAVHEGLKNLELQEPSLRFTKNVMEALEREQAAAASPDHGYKHLPWPLAALFLILSGAGLLSAFLAGNGGGAGVYTTLCARRDLQPAGRREPGAGAGAGGYVDTEEVERAVTGLVVFSRQ